MSPEGRRYGPTTVISTFDAHEALKTLCSQERKYAWLVCNWRIACRELDVSGSEHNPHLRERRPARFIGSVLLGKPSLVRYFIERCPDFVTAESMSELARRMAEVTGDGALDA